MATKYWIGGAPAVAQVGTVQITAGDATTTYKLTVGGKVVSYTGSAVVGTIATGLAAAWNASVHPYFAAVTAGAATDTITLTADTAGVPFVTTSSVSGGAGTIGAYTATTAYSGPTDWATAANWSDFTVPVNGDTVIFDRGNYNCLFGLGQSAVNLASLKILQSFTGYLGLNSGVFAYSADGTTTGSLTTGSTTYQVPEYRTHYLTLDYATLVDIGENYGPIAQNGSARLKISLGSTAASTVNVHNTAATAAESGFTAVRLLINKNTSDVFVMSAPGGVGIAVDSPGETTTVRKVSITDTSTASRVNLGTGVTITTYEQQGGTCLLQAANTPTTVTVNGGYLDIEGTAAITTLAMTGGQVDANSTGTITTANVSGGLLNGLASSKARTWTTLNLSAQGQAAWNSSWLTITNAVGCTDGITAVAS